NRLDFEFPKTLSSEQASDLEILISKEEIRKAVWACGPDGFTFEFFCKFWDTIGPDFSCAVEWSFDHYSFAKGSNSSFIALIPKCHDPKSVTDYRSICLIGSLYKVVTKILAMRLSLVISELIFDVQTAFVVGRQILDGPFIINDLLSWFLVPNGVLGLKGTLLLLIYSFLSWNRFTYHSLELSMLAFSKIDNSVTISHLFYADDAVFVGEWSQENLDKILNVLHCFHLASGLRINVKKSHLLGVGVPHGTVQIAAVNLGCSIMKTPFKYLGVMVGGNSLKYEFWGDIMSKLNSRMSKWKSKTLSIRGRLTLLKSVLGATPIYNMSLFKAKVLASKKFRGLGVSSFYALNRALLSKWVWRFISCDNSLWFRFVKAMHGNGLSTSFWSEIWLEILNFVLSFCLRGVESQQFNQLSELLGLVILSNSLDRWRWDLNGSGEFHVKDVRNLLDDLFLPKDDSATGWTNLLQRGVSVEDLLCPTYHSTQEDLSHVLFSCEVATAIIRSVCRWWNVDQDYFSSYLDWVSWFKDIRMQSKIKSVLEGVFFSTWWSLWNFRNQVIFGPKKP
nr:RNA-directed DNA polymerase, eukaryota, reverse transcriptase zinc-binding domain protein [Tanacetum cinerariifolium]